MQFKKHTYNIILVAALAALTGLTMFGQDVRRNRSLKKASVAQFTPDSISPAAGTLPQAKDSLPPAEDSIARRRDSLRVAD